MTLTGMVLWLLAAAGCYLAFLVWRAKFVLRTMQQTNEQFRHPDHQPGDRSALPANVQRFFRHRGEELERSGLRLLTEYCNQAFLGGKNYHLIYTSPDHDIICELTYMAVGGPTKLMLLLTAPSQLFRGGNVFLSAETNFLTGEAVFTSTIQAVQLPSWITSTFLASEVTVEELLKIHRKKVEEIEAGQRLTKLAVRTIEDFRAKEASQRHRLAAQNERDFEALVQETGTEFLVDRS